jgi:hypothetical protein
MCDVNDAPQFPETLGFLSTSLHPLISLSLSLSLSETQSAPQALFWAWAGCCQFKNDCNKSDHEDGFCDFAFLISHLWRGLLLWFSSALTGQIDSAQGIKKRRRRREKKKVINCLPIKVGDLGLWPVRQAWFKRKPLSGERRGSLIVQSDSSHFCTSRLDSNYLLCSPGCVRETPRSSRMTACMHMEYECDLMADEQGDTKPTLAI